MWRVVWAGALVMTTVLASLSHLKCVFSDPGAVPKNIDADTFAAITQPQSLTPVLSDDPAVDEAGQRPGSRTSERNKASSSSQGGIPSYSNSGSADGGRDRVRSQGESSTIGISSTDISSNNITTVCSSNDEGCIKPSEDLSAGLPAVVSMTATRNNSPQLTPGQLHVRISLQSDGRRKVRDRSPRRLTVTGGRVSSENDNEMEIPTCRQPSAEGSDVDAERTRPEGSIGDVLAKADNSRDTALAVSSDAGYTPQDKSLPIGVNREREGGESDSRLRPSDAVTVTARRSIVQVKGEQDAETKQSPVCKEVSANTKYLDVNESGSGQELSCRRRGKDIKVPYALPISAVEYSRDGRCETTVPTAGGVPMVLHEGKMIRESIGNCECCGTSHSIDEAGKGMSGCPVLPPACSDTNSASTCDSNIAEETNNIKSVRKILCFRTSTPNNSSSGTGATRTYDARGLVSTSSEPVTHWYYCPGSKTRFGADLEMERLATSPDVGDVVDEEDTMDSQGTWRKCFDCRRCLPKCCWKPFCARAAEGSRSQRVPLTLAIVCLVAAARLIRIAWNLLHAFAAVVVGSIGDFFVSPTFSASLFPSVEDALERGVQLPVCTRCQGLKPQRAHHCSVCRRCIVKMDHHCPWINNCVGQLNQKFFLLFLFYVNCMCSLSLAAFISRLFSCVRTDMENLPLSVYTSGTWQHDKGYTHPRVSDYYGRVGSDFRVHAVDFRQYDTAALLENADSTPVFTLLSNSQSEATEAAAGRGATIASVTGFGNTQSPSESAGLPAYVSAAAGTATTMRKYPSVVVVPEARESLLSGGAAAETDPGDKSFPAVGRQHVHHLVHRTAAAAPTPSSHPGGSVGKAESRWSNVSFDEQESLQQNMLVAEGFFPAGDKSDIGEIVSDVADAQVSKARPSRSTDTHSYTFSPESHIDITTSPATARASSTLKAEFGGEARSAAHAGAEKHSSSQQENIAQDFHAEQIASSGAYPRSDAPDERRHAREGTPHEASPLSITAEPLAKKDNEDALETAGAADAPLKAREDSLEGNTAEEISSHEGPPSGRQWRQGAFFQQIDDAAHRRPTTEETTPGKEGRRFKTSNSVEQKTMDEADTTAPSTTSGDRQSDNYKGESTEDPSLFHPGSSSSDRRPSKGNRHVSEGWTDSDSGSSSSSARRASNNSNNSSTDTVEQDVQRSSAVISERHGDSQRLQLSKRWSDVTKEAEYRTVGTSPVWHPPSIYASSRKSFTSTHGEPTSVGVFMCAFVFGLFTLIMFIDQLSSIRANTTGIELLKRTPRYESKGLKVALTEVCGEPLSWRWCFPVNGVAHRYSSYAPLEAERNGIPCEGAGTRAVTDEDSAEAWSSAQFSASHSIYATTRTLNDETAAVAASASAASCSVQRVSAGTERSSQAAAATNIIADTPCTADSAQAHGKLIVTNAALP